MADVRTFRARFSALPRDEDVYPATLKTFLVPVKYWQYRDTRLDARGEPMPHEARIEVRAVDSTDARKRVVREWNYAASFIGQATEVAV